jgi:hypothetical protein
MKCSYTVHPSWFGGQAPAQRGIEELAQGTLDHMRRKGVLHAGSLMSWWEVVGVRIVSPDYEIVTVEYGS